MSYFDDLQLLNVTCCRMYGPLMPGKILTAHHYLGVMQGEFYLDGRAERRPLVYFTPKGIVTPAGWDSPEGKWRDNFYIEISGPRADRLFAAFGAEGRCRVFFVEDPRPFVTLLEEVRSLSAEASPAAATEIILRIESFAALLEESRRGSGICAGRMGEIAKTMAAISGEPGRKWDFSREAARSGVTPRHWNRLFTAAARMSPRRFVSMCRIRLARELLVSGDLPVKQIAPLVGFGGVSEFTRFFKRETGVTPGQYRNSRLR